MSDLRAPELGAKVGDDTAIIVRSSSGNEGSTGHVIIVELNEAGVVGKRDTWYGTIQFFVEWERFVRFEPPVTRDPVPTALCEACG